MGCGVPPLAGCFFSISSGCLLDVKAHLPLELCWLLGTSDQKSWRQVPKRSLFPCCMVSWLLRISVLQKSFNHGSTLSFSSPSRHQLGGDEISWMTVYFLFLVLISKVARTRRKRPANVQARDVNLQVRYKQVYNQARRNQHNVFFREEMLL